MSSNIAAAGRCLCGSVEITAQSMSPDVGACHCNMCRKWSGGPFLVVDCNTDVSIIGEENITSFSSSEWAERGFCSQCGTHLFYKLKQNGQYMVPAGLFDNMSDFKFDHQIFIEEKPEYYTFSNKTKNMTGAEAFAQFAND